MLEHEFQVPRQAATLRLMVEQNLRKAIAYGHFKPGQKLVERELCELIGVGRTSVREALRQLEAEGLITNLPHRGPIVSKISLDEVRQLYVIRAMLEGFCGREFATHGTPEDIAKLVQAVDAFEAAADAADQEKLIETKTHFYDCLMRGGQNIYVTQMLTSLHNRITLLRMTSMNQPGRLKESVRELREIAKAISEGDCDEAEAACKRHIENAAIVAEARMKELETPDHS
ncbi:MAG: GntR family transcriptional regulator [Alphaproteobacteria bacterium]|nr:GntR family transcriptional regulator [Alphaproteobacteria bacterium]